MAKVIDYFIDFCISDFCEKSRIGRQCSYPNIKQGTLSNLFEEKINGKVNRYDLEIYTEDKFHLSYSSNSKFHCVIWLNDILFCDFSDLYINSNQIINYSFNPKQDYNDLLNNKNTILKCELTVNNKVICPKNLLILAFIE